MSSDWIARSGSELLAWSEEAGIAGTPRLVADVELFLALHDEVELTPTGPVVDSADRLAPIAALAAVRPGTVFVGLPELTFDAPDDADF